MNRRPATLAATDETVKLLADMVRRHRAAAAAAEPVVIERAAS